MTITAAFKRLPPNSQRAKKITKSVAEFLVSDLRPYSTVSKPGFVNLMNTLEPSYVVPSRTHFSDKVIPELYEATKSEVIEAINNALSVAITTDGWSSRAVESYVTTTGHFIDDNWIIQNYVLETVLVPGSHTGLHLSEVLKSAAEKWGILKTVNPVVTDNAANILSAVREFPDLNPHITCFAHTLNLATQRGLGVKQLDKLLTRVRKVVAYFKRSPKATSVLDDKIKLLDLPKLKLISDCPTRWNSTLYMLQRFLKLEPAVQATLVTPDLKKDLKNVAELSELAETNGLDMCIEILEKLEEATVLISSAANVTISLILPTKFSILEKTKAADGESGDSVLLREFKKAIYSDLKKRYEGEIKDILLQITALDPRFLQLTFLTESEKNETFENLQKTVLDLMLKDDQPYDCDTPTPSTSATQIPEAVARSSPPAKRYKLF